MLTDETRRKLTEFLGECWHEATRQERDNFLLHGKEFLTCAKCGYEGVGFPYRPFTTPADLFAVYGKLVETDRWKKFIAYCEGKPGSYVYSDDYGDIHIQSQSVTWLFCLATPSEIPDRMAMVYNFLKENK